MDHQTRLHFLKHQTPLLLNQLQISHNAKWGKMSAHHMVEHMTEAFKLSNGGIRSETFITDESRLPLMKRFVLGDSPFKENTKSPILAEELSPLKHATIDEAKIYFLEELFKLFAVYEAKQNLEIRNPIFGDLNYEEQIGLIYKHVQHHFRQFSLVE
jgi:hypothetical protein